MHFTGGGGGSPLLISRLIISQLNNFLFRNLVKNNVCHTQMYPLLLFLAMFFIDLNLELSTQFPGFQLITKKLFICGIWKSLKMNYWLNWAPTTDCLINFSGIPFFFTACLTLVLLRPCIYVYVFHRLLNYFYNIFIQMEDLKKYDVSCECREKPRLC